MAKGGARTRSGPAPDPDALHRERDAGEWTELPKAGRAGDPPAWPLTRATAAESQLWAKLWAMPQAIMWERQRQELEVALYARRFLEAAQRSTPANLSTLARQMADSLGLTTPGLRSNRWKIVDTATASVGGQQRASAALRRARLQVVPDGGG